MCVRILCESSQTRSGPHLRPSTDKPDPATGSRAVDVAESAATTGIDHVGVAQVLEETDQVKGKWDAMN